MLLIVVILGLLALATALAVVLATRVRDRRTIAELEARLLASEENHRQQTSLLSQRASLDTIKDEFISTVSHELRTPLTSIRGALGLLSAGLIGQVDAKAQNLLRIAVNNTDRLIRLINDILDLERMDAGQAPLQIRRCSMRDLAQQSIDTMSAMADSASVRLELASLDGRPDEAFFDGDPDRILQILANLLSNAIKFSPPESTVLISTSAGFDSAHLRVQDEGRGIPPDKLESIFDRFHQVEASDARQKGGTGLGLAICRTIAQQHAGSIHAEPNPSGQGACLHLELPRVGRRHDVLSQPDPLATVPDPTIVLAGDDVAGLQAVIAEQLLRHGYQVLEADHEEQPRTAGWRSSSSPSSTASASRAPAFAPTEHFRTARRIT